MEKTMADRDEYAERAAREVAEACGWLLAMSELRKAVTIIAEAYAPLREKFSRANGAIETMNESMKRLEAELARVTEELSAEKSANYEIRNKLRETQADRFRASRDLDLVCRDLERMRRAISQIKFNADYAMREEKPKYRSLAVRMDVIRLLADQMMRPGWSSSVMPIKDDASEIREKMPPTPMQFIAADCSSCRGSGRVVREVNP